MDEASATGVLEDYEPQGYFCEMLGSPGRPAAFARAVWDRIGRLGLEELRARAHDAELELYNFGITFTVYTQKESIDRILPFDVIPRVISAEDWQTIETGVVQRVTAINLFLKDVYGGQKILEDGVTVIEWGERIDEVLPEARLVIELRFPDVVPAADDHRLLRLSTSGEAWARRREELAGALRAWRVSC